MTMPIPGVTRSLSSHAADYNLHTKAVRTTSDQTVNSGGTGTTLVNVSELVVAALANEVWFITVVAKITTPEAADWSGNISAPSGSSGYQANSTALVTAIGTRVDIAGTTTERNFLFFALVVVGATAGNIQFQFAQVVADAGNTTIKANSALIATKIA